MPMYEVCVLLKPTKKEAESGEMESILVTPMHLIARDERSAGFKAIMDGNLPKDTDLSRVEVLVRPF